MRPGKLSWADDDPRRKGKCSLCENEHYAGGFCLSHYNKNRRHGTPTPVKGLLVECSVDGCHEKITARTRTGLCIFHYKRKKNGVSLNRPKGVSGKLNHNWNGGTSQYFNHYELKKNRLVVLKRDNYTCQYCGKPANQTHHVDLSKDNHSVDNLKACCVSCNLKRAVNKNSKFTSLYGGTIKKLSADLGISRGKVCSLHRKGKLWEFMRNPNSFKKDKSPGYVPHITLGGKRFSKEFLISFLEKHGEL